jgi:predicted 3-demethylubiquinone-9 3-methyltransferase (glyoxalase superfamily)
MQLNAKIAPCLWFDGRAEDAANFYISVFPNSKVTAVTRYTEAGKEFHGKEPGSVLLVAFELDGVTFTALNGGPQFKFTEAVSFQVLCDTQEEVDRYWERLTADGGSPGDCGWVKDKFGLSWQVAPRAFIDMLADHTSAATERFMMAMMTMKKLDIAALKKAFDGPG